MNNASDCNGIGLVGSNHTSSSIVEVYTIADSTAKNRCVAKC